MDKEPYVIKKYPFIGIFGTGLENLREATLQEVGFGWGRAKFCRDKLPLPNMAARVALLATLGMTQERIGQTLSIGYLTVRSHARSSLRILKVPKYTGIARHFFEIGAYEVTTCGTPLQLTPAELPIISALSFGDTRGQVAAKRNVAPSTVKAHIERIGNRTSWHGQKEIIMASILSGAVGDYALHAMAAMPPQPAETEMQFSEGHVEIDGEVLL